MNGSRRYKPYTKEEDNYILENYERLGPEIIAKKLGRAEIAIINKWHRLSNDQDLIKGAIKNTSGYRKIQFIAAMKIIKEKDIKHDNRIPGTIKAVRAGWLDDINIKVV
ncbi:hypothetical protein [Clostridium sp. Cult2]|uniref:hypothetical protein n=1 Tax=Clostridium sp. Cult2 TaxID=2079003 RepID=UPI001F44600C|nr:hypothetical protein [Clostridium sp. Cult2]MCF6466371.1 hypothetical protein [Clostridium sp. Cult2]